MSDTRYTRSEMVLGEGTDKILSEKSVILFGLGGVGSYVAEALARAGVGHITVVDNDTVNITNINRQLCALQSTIGQNKTEVVKNRILDINPECEVITLDKFYLPENSDEFHLENYDYIADAIDTVTSKTDIAVKAQEYNIPVISAMGTGNKLDPSAFRLSDIYKTDTCPLCRVMRYELKKRGVRKMNVVWSPEIPVKNSDIRTLGSVSFVPGAAGLLMASKIIRDLVNSL